MKILKGVIFVTVIFLIITPLSFGKEISPEVVKGGIENYLKGLDFFKNTELEIVDMSLKKTMEIPFDIDAITVSTNKKTSLLGLTTFRVGFMSKGEEVKFLWITANIEGYAELAFAKFPIGKGEIIAEDMVNVKKTGLSKMPKKKFLFKEEVIGKEAKRLIEANTPFSEDLVLNRAVFSKGDKVMIVLKNKAISISAPGEAKERGEAGRLVRVMNLASKKEILARAVDSTHVEVDF